MQDEEHWVEGLVGTENRRTQTHIQTHTHTYGKHVQLSSVIVMVIATVTYPQFSTKSTVMSSSSTQGASGLIQANPQPLSAQTLSSSSFHGTWHKPEHQQTRNSICSWLRTADWRGDQGSRQTCVEPGRIHLSNSQSRVFRALARTGGGAYSYVAFPSCLTNDQMPSRDRRSVRTEH